MGNSSTGRKLRLSVIDRCNLRCRYCAPGSPAAPAPTVPLPLRDLMAAVAWLQSEFQVTAVRLTGGEPLLRPDLVDLVSALAHLPGDLEVSLTTNGIGLAGYAGALRQAGLKRINVSLDSIDPERFSRITGGGRLESTVAGIEAAIAAGFVGLKLNAVLLRSTWRLDVPRLLDFAAERALEIRFIELMNTPAMRQHLPDEFVSAEEVCAGFDSRTWLRPVPRQPGETAQRTILNWNGRDMLVGWITPRSEPFCMDCDRLRMDAGGRLFRCLNDAESFPLASALRLAPADGVRRAVEEYLGRKRIPLAMTVPTPMMAIGG